MAIPTTKELQEQIISDLETQLNVTIPALGKNFIRALAAVQAAKLRLFYLTIGAVQKNIFVDTADPEASGGTLERFGRVKLGRNPFPATAAIYDVDVTGQIGAVIKASTTFKSNDDSLNPGKLYVLDNEVTLTTTTFSIQLRSLETGLETKLNIGDLLTVTSPVANVDSEATVTNEDTTPLAAEDIEDYRQKAIDAYQLEAQGGAATDYRIWSADAQGVAKVYPFAKSGASNEINLFVEATLADSADGKGTPTAQILSDVEDVVEFDPDTSKPLNDRGRRPLGVFQVHFLAIIPLDVDIEVVGFIGLTPELEVLINSAIFNMLADIRPFVSGADILENKNDVLSINKIIFEIQSVIPDSTFFSSINLNIDGNPIATSFTFIEDKIPFLNSLTYV